MASSKPQILFTCSPVIGHANPTRVMAKSLAKLGYNVTFITGSEFEEKVKNDGCTFVPYTGYADIKESDILTRWPERHLIPAGPEQLAFDLEVAFIKVIPGQYAKIQDTLKSMQEQYPGEKIIVITESFNTGAIPLLMKAPGIQPHGIIGMSVLPLSISSIDTAPFGPGLPPDSSEEGRQRNKAMQEGADKTVLAPVNAAFNRELKDLGITATPPTFFDASARLCDRFFQMCIPSVEYPRSDAPANFKFAGPVPHGQRDPWAAPPSWWDEVKVNKAGKKIIGVCQGTVIHDYTKLVIPTIKAFADRDDVLVVVAIPIKNTALPDDLVIPANCRVGDFIPFDDWMPHCDVFVSLAGYGAFQHALANACPVVFAGLSEDKPEVSMRAEWCGLGVNLRSDRPSEAAIVEGVDKILGDAKYKKRALELQAEGNASDPVQSFVDAIEELAAGKPR